MNGIVAAVFNPLILNLLKDEKTAVEWRGRKFIREGSYDEMVPVSVRGPGGLRDY